MTSVVSARTALLVEMLHGGGTLTALVKRVAARSRRLVVLTTGSARPALQSLVDDTLATEGLDYAHRGPGTMPYLYALTESGQEAARQQGAALLALFAPPPAE